VVDRELRLRAREAFDPNGALSDPELQAVLAEIVGTLIAEARIPADQAA